MIISGLTASAQKIANSVIELATARLHSALDLFVSKNMQSTLHVHVLALLAKVVHY